MIGECLVLGASTKVIKDALTIEYLKSKSIDLSEKEKEDILSNESRRFIHFTSEKSAKEIMKSGFLIPTTGKVKNHFTKRINDNGKKEDSEMVYMFDSEYLNIEEYIKNLPMKRSPYNGVYEYYAVSMAPNEQNINSFKRRVQDGAITYDGRLDISYTDTKLVKYVLDLDKNNEYTFKEIGLTDEYQPSDALLEKLKVNSKGKFLRSVGYQLKSYGLDVRKSKESMKVYKANKKEYTEQVKKKVDFAKANKQFKDEEKDKNYIYEQDGKTIVVKNLGYEMIDGQKLQKISIIGNGFYDENKNLNNIQKLCYMDEFDIQGDNNEIETKYFFNNYKEMLQFEAQERYIGLPLHVLENNTVINEYDEEFKEYFERKQEAKKHSDNYIKNNKKGLLYKIKSFFRKIKSKILKEELKLIEAPKEENKYEDKELLAKLGYSSTEEMNRYDPNLIILDELQNQVYSNEEISQNDINLIQKKQEIDEINREVDPDDVII